MSILKFRIFESESASDMENNITDICKKLIDSYGPGKVSIKSVYFGKKYEFPREYGAKEQIEDGIPGVVVRIMNRPIDARYIKRETKIIEENKNFWNLISEINQRLKSEYFYKFEQVGDKDLYFYMIENDAADHEYAIRGWI